MTRPVFEPSLERTDAALGYDKNQLQRRPSDVRLEGISGDRAIQYLWAGPQWHWYLTPPGFDLGGGWSWVKDTTVNFGGYLESNNTGADGNEFFVGAPLGPRWSDWHIDLMFVSGPDYGNLKVQIGTTPMFRDRPGVTDGVSTSGFDIASPEDWLYDIDWYDFAAVPTLDCFGATEVFDRTHTEFGMTMRITGEYGDLLTADGVSSPGAKPITGEDFNGGDGVFWWFRFYVSGKHASSTAYKMKIQGIRLVRAIENDGTPI